MHHADSLRDVRRCLKTSLPSASACGRKWLAWAVFIITIAVLPKFFLYFDIDTFAAWVLGIMVFGTIAFGLGWLYGKVFK